MTDAVSVFPPGFRVTDDATGEPVSGAIISFFDAGTTSPKTVYGDEDLTTAVGTSITCDGLGYPTSDGASTRSLIYVGTDAYKITATDSDGSPLWSHDFVKGAAVSASSVNVAVTALFPVVTKSLDYAVVSGDQNKTIKVNCSAGDVTLTLPSAVTVGTGWKIKVQHAGSANRTKIAVATGSGQIITEGNKSHGGMLSLVRTGEDVEITSDGGNWTASSHSPPFIKVGQGVIPVVDVVASAPGSPAIGSIYLAFPGGTWAGVSVASGDLVQWTGSTWLPVSPPTGCGWLAYVQSASRFYAFPNTFWVAQPLATPATQATMEAQTAGTTVTADMQIYHPGHPKAWGYYTGSLPVSFGIAGVTRTGAGAYTITLLPAMSSGNYAFIASPSPSGFPAILSYIISSANTIGISIINANTNNPVDCNFSFVVLGDK